ncbi:MAG: hypothetical protein B6I30_09985 [Desulfobacteraceae bacterium 4572_187]|nr:MAG: hypothetical protein B6I30_09985 [Desulfobacteraceae bacterium 4572_187]
MNITLNLLTVRNYYGICCFPGLGNAFSPAVLSGHSESEGRNMAEEDFWHIFCFRKLWMITG